MKNRGRVIIMTALLLIGIVLWSPVLRSRHVAAQSVALTGSYGFSATAAYTGLTNSTTLALVGVMTFDGAGNVTGSETIALPDPNPDATTVQTVPATFSGTSTLNPDGTGAINLTVSVQPANPVTISFVRTEGGSSFRFVQTGGGNILLSGTGTKQ